MGKSLLKKVGFRKVGFGGSRRSWRIEDQKKVVMGLSFIENGRNGVELWPCLVLHSSKSANLLDMPECKISPPHPSHPPHPGEEGLKKEFQIYLLGCISRTTIYCEVVAKMKKT